MHKKWCQNAVQSQIIGTQRLRINSPFANNYRIQCITLLAHWKYYQFSFPSMELYLLLKIISKHPKMFDIGIKHRCYLRGQFLYCWDTATAVHHSIVKT